MAEMKGLFKDTAIYGVSSMLGRFLNWGLTPFYTFYITQGELGTMTSYYAAMAMLLILLTMGLETGFFRFAGSPDEDPDKVFSTCITCVASLSIVFILLATGFMHPLAGVMNCSEHPIYVPLVALIVSCDAFSAIPFVYLRLNKLAIRFAALKIFSILLTIILNLFFLLLCPMMAAKGYHWAEAIYTPGFGVGYILIANLIASFVTLLLLLPYVLRVHYGFDFSLLKRIAKYSAPLIILGLAGVMNQHLDKLIYPYLLSQESTAWEQLGVYAANAKIAVILVMFTQAFRYAFEPFIFAQTKGEDKRQSYADATKFFVISGLFIFLVVMFYLDVIKLLINHSYWEGLKVIPIIMLADLFNGIFFNLSLWYKLTDRTSWGAWFSLGGLIVIIVGNVIFVPRIGYMACAWSSFACYFVLMLISYILGQHYYPVPYNLKRIALYFFIAILLYGISLLIYPCNFWIRMAFRTVLLCIYMAVVIRLDLPLRSLLAHLRSSKKE